MNSTIALVPRYLTTRANDESSRLRTRDALITVAIGVLVLAGLAQISIPLPWSPVPITGQTFGVALLSLLFGRKLGATTVLSYLIAGAVGLPVFAGAKAGLILGPTSGYLFGMVLASYWMGRLADRGWSYSFWRAYAVCASGSVIVFACGCLVLSFYVPSSALLLTGVLPFLPGDLIKSALASLIASRTQRLTLPTQTKSKVNI